MASTILIVEDDIRIQKALVRLFSAENYVTRVMGDGLEIESAIQEPGIQAVVLDLMLPKISGRDLCRKIKHLRQNLPVVILSAVSDVADKVLLLELGADDYMSKPFSPRELLARVQAAIRRSERMTTANPETSTPRTLSFGDVTVNLHTLEVERSGYNITMTAQEFKLLKFLLLNSSRVVSREELLTDVWGYDSYPTTRTVDNLILKLRQKLEPTPSEPRYIRTIHGVGYKFVPTG